MKGQTVAEATVKCVKCMRFMRFFFFEVSNVQAYLNVYTVCLLKIGSVPI